MKVGCRGSKPTTDPDHLPNIAMTCGSQRHIFLTNRQITTLMIPEISKWLGINPDVRVTVVWGCDSMTKIIYIQFEILALSNDRSFSTPKFVNDYTSLLIY
jgi:hypothetical protein